MLIGSIFGFLRILPRRMGLWRLYWKTNSSIFRSLDWGCNCLTLSLWNDDWRMTRLLSIKTSNDPRSVTNPCGWSYSLKALVKSDTYSSYSISDTHWHTSLVVISKEMRARSEAYAMKQGMVSTWKGLAIELMTVSVRVTTCLHYCQDPQAWSYARPRSAQVSNGCTIWRLGTRVSRLGKSPKTRYDWNTYSRAADHNRSISIFAATGSRICLYMMMRPLHNGWWIGGWRRISEWRNSMNRVGLRPLIMVTTMPRRSWRALGGSILMMLPFDYSTLSKSHLVCGSTWSLIFLSFTSLIV